MLNTNTFKGVIMNEIKKGDWVYAEDGGEHVFQCSGTMGFDGLVDGGDHWWHEEYCYRLGPLRTGDKLEVGDRVAVIKRCATAYPDIGTIHRVMGFSFGNIKIDFASGRIMLHRELARLPDCTQDKRCETSDVKETHCADDVKDDQPIPYVLTGLTMEAPCPHPEFEGSTWDYCGEGFKIYWENNGWIAHSIKPSEKWNPSFPVHSDSLDLVTEEDSFWRLVELAPQQSTPGKKLERPRKHGGIKTPWNPWEI